MAAGISRFAQGRDPSQSAVRPGNQLVTALFSSDHHHLCAQRQFAVSKLRILLDSFTTLQIPVKRIHHDHSPIEPDCVTI